MFKDLFNLFFKPSSTLLGLRKKPSLGEGAASYFVSFILMSFILFGVFYPVFEPSVNSFQASSASFSNNPSVKSTDYTAYSLFAVLTAFIFVLSYPFAFSMLFSVFLYAIVHFFAPAFSSGMASVLLLPLPFSWLHAIIIALAFLIGKVVLNSLLHTVAKFSKGTGTFKQQFYLMAIMDSASFIFLIPLSLLIIAIGIALQTLFPGSLAVLIPLILLMLVFAYFLYLQIKAYAIAHGFSLVKSAAMVIFLSIALNLMLAVLFFLAVGIFIGNPGSC